MSKSTKTKNEQPEPDDWSRCPAPKTKKLTRVPVSEGSVRFGYRPAIVAKDEHADTYEGFPDAVKAENGIVSLASVIRTAFGRNNRYHAVKHGDHWSHCAPLPHHVLLHKDHIIDLADEILRARAERAPWEKTDG